MEHLCVSSKALTMRNRVCTKHSYDNAKIRLIKLLNKGENGSENISPSTKEKLITEGKTKHSEILGYL